MSLDFGSSPKYHYKNKNPKDLFIPEINIFIGVRHFAYLLKLNKGNILESCQDYNAGTNGRYYNKKYLIKILKNFKKSNQMKI